LFTAASLMILSTVSKSTVAQAEAYYVRTFRQLAEIVARLSYLNKDYLLFFRGQGRDYQNKAGSSTVYPSIYRFERLPDQHFIPHLTIKRFDVAISPWAFGIDI
jgi:hypothetical protein